MRGLIFLFYRNGFCEVSGLVDILALADGDVISEQLQRDGGYQRFEALHDVGQFDDLVSNLRDGVVALRDKRDDTTLTGLDFLDVREHLLVHGVMCCYNHDGHIAINQRDRSVLHLSGGITLGMDIGNLLQFQRALQSHGIGEATK